MPQLTVSGRRRRSLLGLALVGILVTGLPCRPAAASALRRSAIVEAVQQARPAVVNITGRKTLPAEQVHSAEMPHQVNGMGTGIVIDARGYIITNHHVVEGVGRIRITMADGSSQTAVMVAHDPQTDLAIIKMPADSPLPVIQIGTSTDLMPGETVIAVGNAYGYEHTVTQGIISALHRSVQVSDQQKYHDLIQTDASINPGNSGGPLLNIDGEMIGINVAVRVGAQGIGFAIPVDQALEVAAELLGDVAGTGVEHGLHVKTVFDPSGSRVVVDRVDADSPAGKAGLAPADLITSIAGQDVYRALDVQRVLLDRTAGEELPVTIDRQGQAESIALVLAEATRLRSSTADRAWQTLGVRLSPVAATVFRQYQSRYRGGLKVLSVRPNGPAAGQGIRRGDVLVGLHKWETTSLDNVSFILDNEDVNLTEPLKFFILRNGETLYGFLTPSGS